MTFEHCEEEAFFFTRIFHQENKNLEMILSTIVCLIINIFLKWIGNVLWGREE